MKTKQEISSKCYHCGDNCTADHIVYQEKKFCCEGCKLVYDLLEKNELCDYYNLDESPGATAKDVFDAEKFAYLDLDEVVHDLVGFQEGSVSKVEFFIPKIHCSSCIWLLENLQRLHSGVRFSRVNFTKKEVVIAFEHEKISLRSLVELLTKVGYEPQITLESKSDEEKNTAFNRSLFIKLGIVGFCFGNMMLISFPEYISFGHYIEENFRSLFSYLNIGFSIPVLWIAAMEYLIPSVQALRTKQISIDVPIAIGIVALFLTSLTEIFLLGESGYLDSFGGLIFFLLLGKAFQQKTYDTLSFDRDYKSYFPISVQKIEKGKKYPVTLQQLKIGDEIEIKNQELIPVDAYIKNGAAKIDYSFMTGESDLISKEEGDKVFAGGKQVGGAIRLLVEKEFSQSQMINLWNNEAFSKNKESSFDSLTMKVSKYFTVGILVIAAGSFLFWLPQHWDMALKAMVSVLIVACPCALALSSPFSLGSIMRVFGKHKLFLKNALVSDMVGQVDTIVFDKTGTLTDQSLSEVKYNGVELSELEVSLIASLTGHSLHPLSKQIHQHYSLENPINLDSIDEEIGQGLVGQYKGLEIRLGRKQFVSPELSKDNEDVNGSRVYVSIGGVFKGVYLIQQGYRKGVLNEIKALSKKYQLFVLSGDGNSQEGELKKWFGADSNLLFHQSPESKLKFIQGLKNEGKIVMMIGDGLNDAGALKSSDVGIALTDDITSFSPSSDGIMDASGLVKLGQYLKVSKLGHQVIKISFFISIIYNLIGLSFAVQGLLTPVFAAILMPLSSITVVLFTTGSISLIGGWMMNKRSIVS